MPKNKRPAPRTSNNPRPAAQAPDLDALAQQLSDLALEIAESEDLPQGAPDEREQELTAAVRKLVRKRRDEVLYEAIELARFTDPLACRLLRERIGEEAAAWTFTRDDGVAYEIDAFLVPLFVRSRGGLVARDTFQDEQAFAGLSASFVEAGLDSPSSRVVLLQHAYDLAEIDHISYGTLHEMLREAAASLLEKKLRPAPTIEASMRGWTGEPAAPDEMALELRFLLGFSLKRSDDPFYHIPADEAGSDAWFAARMERYRAWTLQAGPLLARSLSAGGQPLELNFLYQDQFFSAKEQGVAELATLSVLAEVKRMFDAKDLAADAVHAVVAPLDMGDHVLLRANLYAIDGGPPWGSVDKPVDLAADLVLEVDELCDALLSLGLEGVSIAAGFSDDGHAEGAEPYQPA